MVGAVSRSFDAYMGIYVSLEDKQLDEALGKSLEGEGWTCTPTGRVDDACVRVVEGALPRLKRSFKRGTPLHMGNVLITNCTRCGRATCETTRGVCSSGCRR